MAERQTTTLVTKAGNSIVLRSYLTGREAQDIKTIMLSSLKMTMSDLDKKKVDMGALSGTVLAEQERKTVEYLLVSVNGISDNPLEKLLDLPSSEYKEVLEAVEKIKDPTTPENSE